MYILVHIPTVPTPTFFNVIIAKEDVKGIPSDVKVDKGNYICKCLLLNNSLNVWNIISILQYIYLYYSIKLKIVEVTINAKSGPHQGHQVLFCIRRLLSVVVNLLNLFFSKL